MRRIQPIAAAVLFVSIACPGIGAAQSAPSSSSSTGVSYWTVRPDVAEMGSTTPLSRVEVAPEAAQPAGEGQRKSHEWLIAPLPMINPTLENGLALVAGLLYPIGTSPASASLLAGFRTSNDSWMAGAVQTLHLKDDRYRVIAAGAYFDVNFDFFGIGADAGDQGVSVLLNQTGSGGLGELLVHAGARWYIGARYRISKTTIGGDFSQPAVPIPAGDVQLRTGVLGPRLQRDTRDNQFYPRAGTLFDLTAGFAGKDVGGRRSYHIYQAAFSTHSSLTPRQVVATKINSCGATGDVPFYDLCLLGQFQDLRGYPSGQYRDRGLLTAQAEYRVEVWRWVGLAAFAGTGEVVPSFKQLAFDALLPSGGGGLRFRLTKQTHVNLRVDYAWGKKSQALYVSVAEAF